VIRAGLLALACAGPAVADEREAYISANTIGIFYHELAHAVIDLYDIPIRIKEEDAADNMSVLMVDYGFDDASGAAIANDIAFTFSVDAETSRHFFWQQHSSDKKRADNTICMFAGGDPDNRADLADDWGLSPRGLDRCADERAAADAFWAPFLDDMTNEDKQRDYVTYDQAALNGSAARIFANTVREEVAAINNWIVLPEPLNVRVEECGEANAFYDPSDVLIVMCTEYADHLAAQLDADAN